MALACALLAAVPNPAAHAQDDDGGDAPPAADAPEPVDVPVSVEVTFDTKDLTTTGLFTLRADFTADEDVKRPLSVVIDLVAADRVCLSWDHAPTPPPAQWRKGQKVRCEFLAPFPRELTDGRPGATVDVYLGFRDPARRKVFPPRGSVSLAGGKAFAGDLRAPDFEPVATDEAVARILAAADEFAKAGRKPDAWSALEFGIRGAPDDVVKYRLRNAMAKLGDFAPRPLSQVEERIVEQRIDDERRRWLRQQSGRLYDQGKLHAALLILEAVGGKLQEQADAAVVGALSDAKRVEKDMQDIREKIWERMPDADRAEVEKVLAAGRNRAALDRARSWVREGKLAAARRVFRDLAVTAPKDVAGPAFDEAKELDRRLLDEVPPPDRAAADAALRNPVFARTAVSLSHQFVFIGPKNLVDTIPPGSRTAFDLAYVFVTDLFGRRPNPAGDRVTVYFKELWDFGGGVGGGKTIDIGNAKPDATATPVDTGLLFHELTHCVDDTTPIHAGFREGLADFGATYAHEALGRTADSQRGFAAAARAFREDYLARDLEYWRIPNYGPSAGFFLHFTEKYGRAPVIGHSWAGWRRFFREYRDAAVRDGRETTVCRSLAYHLMRAFGAGAFDDLVQFRFPLVPSDREAVVQEMEGFASGDPARGEAAFDTFPNSQLRRDLAERRMIEAARGSDPDEARRIGREELGIVHDWRVIGPFEGAGLDPGARVFPPEFETDFAKEYPQRMNTARWRLASEGGPVEVEPIGWVAIKYAYMDETATYALTHVTVPAETEAFAHLRADDEFALFLNGERIDGEADRGWNGSTPLPWRGPVGHAPDALRLPVRLRAGRNRVLVKVRNRGGPAGFVLALSRRDGCAIPGLVADTEPPAPQKPAPEPKWRTVEKLDFRGKGSASKVDVTVGGFDSIQKMLVGTSTSKGVAWRKYTVRPGFPKDSPSNLLWLKSKATDGLADFRLTIALEARKEPPKLAVTFQGEGGTDGLSGWNLLLWNRDGRPAGQLERYEDRWYEWWAAEAPPKEKAETSELVVTLVAWRLTATLNGVPLVTGVPVRAIPGKSRIGLSTWGVDPKIAGIELEAGK